MPNVTQTITNYLGGVSRQPDTKKLPGQVTEAVNAYPDPTFGLTKRPGFKFLTNLGNANIYDNAKWFYIHRDGDEKYIGCIKGTAIYIWNATSGVQATVSYTNNANTTYLTGTNANDYDVLTVQDTTLITNKTKTITTQAAPSFTANAVGTVRLRAVTVSTQYDVTINGTTVGYATGGTQATADTILLNLKNNIDALNIAGLTVTRLDNSLELSGTSTFTLSGKGGTDNERLDTFQDQVANVGTLPDKALHDRVVKVLNTESNDDTYYARFRADNGVSGNGYWEEYIAPNVSPGLDDTSMPHELVNTGLNTFTFRSVSYTDRLVGDDTTNSHPSFVGKKIQQAFFHSSRLGFLVDDNVSLSQANEFFNFYHVSARTQIASDPVDLSTSSIRPTLLTGVLPTAQGLILFSKNQQFLMFAPNGIFTPTTTIIRGISNYEMDINIDPVDNGNTMNFVSKTPGYTRIYQMRTSGQEMNPVVLDIGRVVSEYIPSNITDLIASPQNSFIAMWGTSAPNVYFYRTYSNGQEEVMQAWFKWQLPGNVQTLAVDSDVMYAVTMQGGKYTLCSASLNQTPEESILVNSNGDKMNPCVDLYATASSVVYDETDPINPFSKCYIPFENVSTLTPVLVIGSDLSALQNQTYVESGFTITPTVATDGTGTYYKVPFKNLTSVANKVIVGFKYTFDVELPTTYYRLDPNGFQTDFTANLTVARMKFSTGLSGVLAFKLKRNGANEYNDVQPIALANFYLANDVPLADQTVVTVPIHQRNTNFELKVSSDSPFPVSLASMMWEGFYTPRFYRRA